MDYLERLIRRALALPHAQVPDAFDPFEQVAPWPLDARVGAQTAAPMRVGKPAGPPPAPPPLARATVARQQDLPASAPRPAEPGVPAPSTGQPAPPMVKPEPAADDGPEQRSRVQPGRVPERAPLARADAFMRSLGVPSAAPEAPSALPAAPARGVEPATPPPAAPVRGPASRSPLPPVMVRPVPPRVPAPSEPAPAARRLRQPAPIPASAPQPAPRRAEPGAVPERILQTTVVVAPASNRLDDLAHSSGIARFGIGQN